MGKTKLRPVLDGDFWMLGPSPVLDLPKLVQPERNPAAPEGAPTHECVDHHVFQSADGAWHLWGCIRKTTVVGRILYRWEGHSLTEGPWQPTGEIIRVDRTAGESLSYHDGEECIQSPFVVEADGGYFMFYGGDGSGTLENGTPIDAHDPEMAGQMCLMTSPDGRQWTRHLNDAGQSRVFVGPMAARDPCLIHINGLWHLYYAGFEGYADGQAGFYARTSSDLVHWSEQVLVHLDSRFGGHRWQTECPHVVYREGYYYLFRTVHYTTSQTHVFRSEDPLDFGINDASAKVVGPIAVAAPEIIVDGEGNEFITSNHNLAGGTMMCRLKWEG